MNGFPYQNGQLFCEAVPLVDIATAVGTPAYVYSQAALSGKAQVLLSAAGAAGTLACYALKANGNPAILRLLAEAGLGADVTSGGELFLAQHAGIPPHKIIFSGTGKQPDEMAQALAAGIGALHVESEMELHLLAEIAAGRQQTARIGVRVNPDIGVETHPAISTGQKQHKFGVAPSTAVALLQLAHQHPWLQPVGLAAHLGSQITAVAPFAQLAQFLVALADELAAGGIRLEYLDAGGGLGIDYGDLTQPGTPPPIAEWVTAVSGPIHGAGYRLVLEPGRSLVGPAGVLLTRVLYTKSQGGKQFAIVDTGMNDLIRPALYHAYHPLLPVAEASSGPQVTYDVVGPVCETGDWLARERRLPPLRPGDLLAVMQAGAYGFAMSSNYNGRPKPAEVLVHRAKYRLIRQRQTVHHLLDGCDL